MSTVRATAVRGIAVCAIAASLLSATTVRAQSAPEFGETFWEHWGDGRAEISSYDLTFPRYGELREGKAVLIFVTEPFTTEPRVKADAPGAPPSDVFQVMKLNLIRDFPTGIYDYNTMVSTFVGLEPFAGLPAGSPAKVTFSSQEWCGQVWHQAVFHPDHVATSSHSYFGAEGDQSRSIPRRGELWTEDQLFHWARGLALPVMEKRAETLMIPTLLEARLEHRQLDPRTVELRRGVRRETVETPIGAIEAAVHEAQVVGGPTWSFWIELAPPHRIVQWATSDGERATLRGSDRVAYWKMNDPGSEKELRRIGL